MKKYAIAASLFLFNNEIVSWLALVIIAGMAVIAFLKEAESAGMFK